MREKSAKWDNDEVVFLCFMGLCAVPLLWGSFVRVQALKDFQRSSALRTTILIYSMVLLEASCIQLLRSQSSTNQFDKLLWTSDSGNLVDLIDQSFILFSRTRHIYNYQWKKHQFWRCLTLSIEKLAVSELFLITVSFFTVWCQSENALSRNE